MDSADSSSEPAYNDESKSNSTNTEVCENDNVLLVFGKNNSCQLGLGHAERILSPQKLRLNLPSPQVIRQVFCGYSHTFVLTSSDEIFGFGRNSKGQLGLGNTDDQRHPQRVHLLCGMSVTAMAAGIDHSLALTKEGEIYSFGGNSSGQLGLGHTTPKEQTPQRVPSLCGLGARQISCGKNHTMVLCGGEAGGLLLAFGDNRFGQLGLGGFDDALMVVSSTPQKVRTFFGMGLLQVSCGYNFTLVIATSGLSVDAESSNVASRGGQLYSFGENSYGQLGLGHTEHTYAPNPVRLGPVNVSSVWAGCGKEHSLILGSDDELYTFGSNLAGQLGQGPGRQCHPVPSRLVAMGGQRIQALACGKHSNFALSSCHQMFGWGENTLGQLGVSPAPSTDTSFAVPAAEGDVHHTGSGGEPPKKHSVWLPKIIPDLSKPGFGIAVKGQSGFWGRGVGAFDHQKRCPLHEQLVTDFGSLLALIDKPHSLSDITFMVEDMEGNKVHFYLHWPLLAARCPRLAALVPYEKENSPQVELDSSIKVSAFTLLINYLYTGDTDYHETRNQTYTEDIHKKDIGLLFSLMILGRDYALPQLYALCEKRIHAAICVENVAEVLSKASDSNFRYLQRQCLSFALANYPQVTHPSQTLQLVQALQTHPQMLANLLQLGNPFKEGKHTADCIQAIQADPAPFEEDTFQSDFSRLFKEQVVPADDTNERTRAFMIQLGQGGKMIRSHRAILAARSGFFSGMLSGCTGMTESMDGVFTLLLKPPPSTEAFMAFLGFIYTGIPYLIEPAQALEILTMVEGEVGSGGYFQLKSNDHLREVCQRTMLEKVTSSNVWPLLERADAIGDKETKDTATQYIIENFAGAVSGDGIQFLRTFPHLAVDILEHLSKTCRIDSIS